MKAVDDLLAVLDKLLSEDGCPWDREQTLLSMRASLLEEASELIEAIDLDDVQHIQEELGDLGFVYLFLCRLAEKEGKCTLESALHTAAEKLIRRHPHVFKNAQSLTSDQVLEQWGQIKSTEKGKDTRKSVLDGIPKGLPALARAQKILKKMSKSGYKIEQGGLGGSAQDPEIELGTKLLALLTDPAHKGIDAEQSLRKVLAHQEIKFREHENLHPTPGSLSSDFN